MIRNKSVLAYIFFTLLIVYGLGEIAYEFGESLAEGFYTSQFVPND